MTCGGNKSSVLYSRRKSREGNALVGSLGISFVRRRVATRGEGTGRGGGYIGWFRPRGEGERCGGGGVTKGCVYALVCVRVYVCVCWVGGGAMLMSAPFYSLTSRSNYLAYPGSSINVFQPPPSPGDAIT